VSDLDAPGVANGAEHRLLVVPTDTAQLKVLLADRVWAAAAVTPRSTRTGSGRPATSTVARLDPATALNRLLLEFPQCAAEARA
jgi:hypothetical protein